MYENILNLDFLITRKKELGYTNEIVSQLSGIPKSTVDKIFAGFVQNPKLTTMRKIAKTLQCTLDDMSINSARTEIVLDVDEHNIIKNYRALTEQGKEKIREYMSDILESKKYTAAADEEHSE